MSQLKVNSIVDAAGGSSAVLYGVASPPNSMGFRNRIINGEMRIDQRNAGASVSMSTGSNVFPVDRFQGAIAQGSGHTAQQSTSAPAGFVNSVLVTIGTGASPAAGNVARLYQPIEGFNIADLGWGLATASTITLSFWVKSSLTGTFAGGIYNNAANRTYVFTYAISAANTWEQKTVTIAGDTSGTWLTNNSAGFIVNWDLGTGSTYQGTAGVWAAGAAWATSGSVKLAGTSGATWQITGVQLEAGSVASPFERRDYGRELMMCQRYFYKWTPVSSADYATNATGLSTTAYYGVMNLPVLMRTTPTLSTSGTATDYGGYFSPSPSICNAVPIIDTANNISPLMRFLFSGGGAAGGSGIFGNRTINGFFGFSAEL